MNDELKFYPAKYKNTYKKLAWKISKTGVSAASFGGGHRIPAYFLPEGGYVVAETAEEA